MFFAWDGSNWLSLVAVVVAVVVPFVLFGLDKQSRDRDAAERAREREEDRAERERDRAERLAERRLATIDVRLVSRPAALSDLWWRLSLVGGNAFSRVTVTRFEKRDVGHEFREWEPATPTWPGPVTLAAGQTAHFRAVLAMAARPEVLVEWTHDGAQVEQLRREVFVEPWT